MRVKARACFTLWKMFIKIALINYEKNRWTAKSGTSFSGSFVSARDFFFFIFQLLLLVGTSAGGGFNNSNNESNRSDNRIELRCNNVSLPPAMNCSGRGSVRTNGFLRITDTVCGQIIKLMRLRLG